MEKKLNLDIPGAVSEFEMLIKKVLPRNIMYKFLLSKGLEFDGYRDYTQADEASNIDWKASVRGKRLLMRKYIEERDLKFMFIIDVSDNMVFGSTEKLKCEYAAELSAAVAHLMLTTGDRVGFVLFSNKVLEIRIPKLGTKQFDIFAHSLSDPLTYGGVSDLNKVLEELIETLDRSTSLVFLISDFVKVDENHKKNLETLANLFETVAVIIRDPLDKGFPALNKEVIIENPETGEKLLINPKVAKGVYERNALNQLNSVKQIFRDFNIDFLELLTDKPFSPEFAGFLKERISGGRVVRKNVY
jgi:uncharacterized protein (DUF58 family)